VKHTSRAISGLHILRADCCWSPEEEPLLLLLLHPTQIALVKGASRLITNDLMQIVRINKDHSLTLEVWDWGLKRKLERNCKPFNIHFDTFQLHKFSLSMGIQYLCVVVKAFVSLLN
jgi:hypothetical protein